MSKAFKNYDMTPYGVVVGGDSPREDADDMLQRGTSMSWLVSSHPCAQLPRSASRCPRRDSDDRTVVRLPAPPQAGL
jgi:hypothetical protein